MTKRLRSSLREEDAIARLGSDEFAVVQAGVTRPEEVAMLARRLIAAISEPYLFDGHTIEIRTPSARSACSVAST